MSDLKIVYRLPVSALRFSGTRTETTDTVLGTTAVARDGTVELDVVGGEVERVLTLDRGFLRDVKSSFTRTEDGRLTGLEVSSTGQGGKALLGVVSAAATIAGAFAGMPPGVLGADTGDAKPVEEMTPAERVAKAYKDASQGNAEVATVRAQYEKLVKRAVEEIAVKSDQLLRAKPGADRAALLNALRTLQQQLPVWRAELDRLQAHFAAWRAGTIVRHSTQHADVLHLDHLRDAGIQVDAGGNVMFGNHASGAKAKAIWERFGLLVTMPASRVDDIPEQPREDNTLVLRETRITELSVYERQEDDTARLQRTMRVLVVDSASAHDTVEFDSSWFGKREANLTFSALGTLTGIASESESSAANALDTLGKVGSTLQSGLETAQKTRTAWVGLRESGTAEELERVKRQVELKQKQLELSGLTTTDAQYAELQRLTQEAAILEKRKLIGDAALDDGAREVTALKQQVDLLKNQKDLSEATRTLQAERELYELRLEIERLEAEKKAAGGD